MKRTASLTERRIAVALSGALGGLAAWAILDLLTETDAPSRLVLALATGVGGFFTVLMATLGPLSTLRAALAGCIVGVPAAVLMVWASLRFDTVSGFLESGHPLAALFLLIALPIPFMVAGLGPARNWSDYPTLFDAAWATLVRASAALVFTGLFWALVFLSDVLLGLVGVRIIDQILRIEVTGYLLSGAAFGLGIAVAHEMSDYVSPHLPLRLLRLLLPLALVVSAIFLAALPFQGLSDLFGNFSAAGTLMGMAFAGITLVSAALDRDDGAAVSGIWRRCAAAMACLLPLFGGLAALAVAERVAQYGWTPNRIAAATGAALLTAYGLAYLFAVVRRHNWTRRVRRANTGLAVVTLTIAGLWLTPLIDPQRISALHQLSRFTEGGVEAAELDLWSMSRDWGRAGQAVIGDFGAAGDPQMDARLAALATATNRFDFEQAAPTSDMRADLETIRARLLVLPEGAELPPGILDAPRPGDVRNWADACRRETPGGHPGCVAILGDFVPREPGPEVVMIFRVYDSFSRVRVFIPSRETGAGGGPWEGTSLGDLSAFTGGDAIDRLMEQGFEIAPKSLNVLRLDGSELIVLP